MTKSEAEKIVQDAIAKVLGESSRPSRPRLIPRSKRQQARRSPRTLSRKPSMQPSKRHCSRKRKSPSPKPEAEQFIDRLVAKAVSASVTAVRSSRGNPTNLNGTASGTVEKSAEQHYLHGIL